jgi:ABC-type transport system involved in cytochrome bd biosynthesis fused ATPase/permease subunit
MPGLGKSGVMVCPRCTEPVREMTPEDRAPADTKPVDPALVGVVPAFAPCTKGCGEMTTGGGACFDCTRNGDNKNKIADTTEASIPAGFRWARFEEPLLRQRLQASFDRVGMSKPTVDEVLTAARDAATANRVMLVGSTGKGKTSLVVAMMRQWVRANASSALFVYTPDLVTSRMRTKLGREADMVPEAMAAPLLVLDDVGGGDVKLQAGPLEEVIHKRHAERKPTWATTWMLPKSMTDGNRYSGGFVRRLFEGVREIDLVGSR